MTRLDTL